MPGGGSGDGSGVDGNDRYADEPYPADDDGDASGGDQPTIPLRLPRERGRRLRERLARRLSDGRDRLVESGRSTPFVPDSETVMIDERQHPVALVAPVARLLTVVVVLVSGFALLPVLLLAALAASWARVRVHAGAKGMAIAAAAAVAGVVLIARADGALRVLLLLLLLAWVADDLGDWWADRLVVSDRRIYRRYGIVTRHSPSIALTAVAFIDASVPPLGRVFGYGTLRLDSVAQRDAPLSRFDRVPDVVAVHHRVLQLRSAAMPRFPGLPH